jgi:hypothetical protein
MRTARRLGALMVGMALVAVPAVTLAQGSGAESALTLDRLAPGISRQGTVSVTNPSDQPVTVALETSNLSDDDQTDRVSFDRRTRTIGVAGDEVGEPEVLGAQASAGGQAQQAISVPSIVDAGLVGPVTAAAAMLTSDLPVAIFTVLLVLALGLTVRVLRHGRNR